MTKAFDLALFVGTPANVNDASVVSAMGPPFTTSFKSVALSSKPGGVTVANDVPAATASGQIMLSGAGPGFAWDLVPNPAAAASVPPPTAPFDMIMANGTPSWVNVPISTVVLQGGFVTNAGGASFALSANVVFAPSVTPKVRIDGGDPAQSILDNFSWDAGTF